MPTARGCGHRCPGRAAGVLAAAVAVVLSGCSTTVGGEAYFAGLEQAKPTVPPAPPGSTDPAAPPLTGTCWQLAEGQEETPLQPPEQVECSGDHDAETAVVGDSGLGEEDPRPTEADLDDANSPVSRALADLCGLDVVREYLSGDELDDPYAYVAGYLPDEEQWAAGARWARCDVYYGYDAPETVPGVLQGALAGGDDAFRACFAGVVTDYTVVPCSQPHEAEPVGTEVAPLPEDPPYPDEAARRSLVGSCTGPAQEYGGGEVPHGYAVDVWLDTPDEWTEAAFARCVLVPAGGGRTTASVRP
ncbi:putative regulator of septum formation [Geodermatophilus normandii]|uniref:Putative regulator of septum formation n=1 Tax=Geodermatophilus normandii TaxID=1137989 RepID=A0A317QMY1_9ACTN|nr:septum formation family protein [Geodermatophilus normandii]PWW24284.1 putative regulator of septum formation [Geodermatophilus normandii]